MLLFGEVFCSNFFIFSRDEKVSFIMYSIKFVRARRNSTAAVDIIVGA